METGSRALEGLVREISRHWSSLELPPVTDWDLFEVLLEASRPRHADVHGCKAVTATLLAARSKLAQARNERLAGPLLQSIDEELRRLRRSSARAVDAIT